jgi:hypothetical protein
LFDFFCFYLVYRLYENIIFQLHQNDWDHFDVAKLLRGGYRLWALGGNNQLEARRRLQLESGTNEFLSQVTVHLYKTDTRLRIAVVRRGARRTTAIMLELI